jgi:hypothetical protein
MTIGAPEFPDPKIVRVQCVSKNLDAYMRFRAAKEGVGYDLNPAFYQDGMAHGCNTFFGRGVARRPNAPDVSRNSIAATDRSLVFCVRGHNAHAVIL